MPNPEIPYQLKIMPLEQPSDSELLFYSYLDSDFALDKSKRKFVIFSFIAGAGLAAGLAFDRLLPYIKLGVSPNVKRLENTIERFSRASKTEFELSWDELLNLRIRTFGDSVLAGVNEDATFHPDSSYQIYGMNTNYNKLAEYSPNLPGPVQWEVVPQATSGTETDQWEEQVKNFEINFRILQMYEESLEDIPDTGEESDEGNDDFNDLNNHTEKRSETWQIGSAANGLFHLAYRKMVIIKQLLEDNQDPEKIEELVNAVSDEDTLTIVNYRKDLETIHYLKQLGVNIDRLIVIGIPDPTILNIVPVENPDDPYGAPIIFDLSKHSNIREYASNAIKDLNNRIKEMVDSFMDAHPDMPVLYIGPEEFLTSEDMHDIHPDKRGYWKIARKILDHYFVKIYVDDSDLGRTTIKLYLGPIALPNNDPNMPETEKKSLKLSRRKVLSQLLKVS